MAARPGSSQKISRTAANIQHSQGENLVQGQPSDTRDIERHPESIIGIFSSAGGVAPQHILHFASQSVDTLQVSVGTDPCRQSAQLERTIRSEEHTSELQSPMY